jgi:hypothetical protein
MAVQLPDGEDTNEWLAVHGAISIDFVLIVGNVALTGSPLD